ncbi:MAG: hypothetical protein EZS28_036093, partial [Streblomastix strix]
MELEEKIRIIMRLELALGEVRTQKLELERRAIERENEVADDIEEAVQDALDEQNEYRISLWREKEAGTETSPEYLLQIKAWATSEIGQLPSSSTQTDTGAIEQLERRSKQLKEDKDIQDRRIKEMDRQMELLKQESAAIKKKLAESKDSQLMAIRKKEQDDREKKIIEEENFSRKNLAKIKSDLEQRELKLNMQQDEWERNKKKKEEELLRWEEELKKLDKKKKGKSAKQDDSDANNDDAEYLRLKAERDKKRKEEDEQYEKERKEKELQRKLQKQKDDEEEEKENQRRKKQQRDQFRQESFSAVSDDDDEANKSQKNYKKQSSRELISKPVVADQFQSQTDLDTDKTQDQQKDQQKSKSDFQQQQSTTSVTPPSSHSPVFAEIGVDTSSLEPAFILDETTGEEILASPLSLTQTQRDSDYQSLYSLSQTKRGGSNSPQLQIYQQQGNSVLTQTSNSSTQRGKKQKIGEMRVNASTDTDSLMSRRLQMVNTTTSMEEIQFSEIGVQYSDEQSLTPKSRDVSVWTTK